MKYSIIITAHKERGYLDECIISCKEAAKYCIEKCSSDDFEIILASDGNPKLKLFADKHNILFSLSEPHKNLAKSFNNAVFNVATGDYVKIIADDDVIDSSGFYELCHNSKSNPDVLFSNYSAFEKNINAPKFVYKTDVAQAGYNTFNIVIQRRIGNGTTMYKRSSFIAVGGMDDNYDISEGYILFIKLLQAGFNRFLFVDKTTVHYRLHPEQKSQNAAATRAEKMTAINKKYNV